jgi:hypothetical protein
MHLQGCRRKNKRTLNPDLSRAPFLSRSVCLVSDYIGLSSLPVNVENLPTAFRDANRTTSRVVERWMTRELRPDEAEHEARMFGVSSAPKCAALFGAYSWFRASFVKARVIGNQRGGGKGSH